ncbi:unnamed protein product [Rhizoctonia solani]|uniref:Uncharacterized protein n=1 Tax=Rhizoctonia solani TaxID=456999 RepID=A0A8H3DZ17_9AGAM|nr:unnamed protein product [Rhizoctonia solani]
MFAHCHVSPVAPNLRPHEDELLWAITDTSRHHLAILSLLRSRPLPWIAWSQRTGLDKSALSGLTAPHQPRGRVWHAGTIGLESAVWSKVWGLNCALCSCEITREDASLRCARTRIWSWAARVAVRLVIWVSARSPTPNTKSPKYRPSISKEDAGSNR